MRLAAISFVCVALLAGCGDDEADTGTDRLPDENVPAAPKAASELRIETTEFALDPAQAEAGEAGLVEIDIRNKGDVAHSLAVEGPNGLVELDGRIEPGDRQTLEVDLDKPGSYVMYCPLDGHRGRGMEGSITVTGEGAARGADPDTTTPSDTTTETSTTPTRTTTQTETQTRTTTQTETVTTPTETEESPTATVRTPGED